MVEKTKKVGPQGTQVFELAEVESLLVKKLQQQQPGKGGKPILIGISKPFMGKKFFLTEDTYHIVNPQKPDPPQMQINLNEVAPPVAKGEKLGQAVFREGDKEVARVDLVAENAIPGPRYWLWVGGIGGGVTLLGILAAVKAYRKRRRRYIFAGRGGKLRLR